MIADKNWIGWVIIVIVIVIVIVGTLAWRTRQENFTVILPSRNLFGPTTGQWVVANDPRQTQEISAPVGQGSGRAACPPNPGVQGCGTWQGDRYMFGWRPYHWRNYPNIPIWTPAQEPPAGQPQLTDKEIFQLMNRGPGCARSPQGYQYFWTIPMKQSPKCAKYATQVCQNQFYPNYCYRRQYSHCLNRGGDPLYWTEDPYAMDWGGVAQDLGGDQTDRGNRF